MSYNLIYNCKFVQPIISTDSFIDSTDFTTDQQKCFYWSFGIYACFKNGNTTIAFPNPILINTLNFVVFNILVIYNNNLQWLYKDLINYHLIMRWEAVIFLIIFKYINMEH